MSGKMMWLLGICLPQVAIGVVSCISLLVTFRKKADGDSVKKPLTTFIIGSVVYAAFNLLLWDKRTVTMLTIYTAAVFAIACSYSKKAVTDVVTIILAFAMLGIAVFNEKNFYENYSINVVAVGEAEVTETNIDLVPVNNNSMVAKTSQYGEAYKYAYISEKGEKLFEFALAKFTNVHYIGENEKAYLIKTVEDVPAKNTNFCTQWDITKETTRYELYIQAEEIGG
jgi:hypothetical protein